MKHAGWIAVACLGLMACGADVEETPSTADAEVGAAREGLTRYCSQQSDCRAEEGCCGGRCVDVFTDLDHCGNCDSPCDGICSLGTCHEGGPCGLLVCKLGESCCDYACVDARTNEDHCGGCGRACQDHEQCVDRQCLCEGVPCDGPGATCCGGVGCVDALNDPRNCGACGNVCGADQTCVGGACQCRGPDGVAESCSDDETCCPGLGCVALYEDEDNCGACGVSCGDGETCVNGLCRCGTSFGAPGEPVCTGGNTCCSGSCRHDCDCGGTACGESEECCDVGRDGRSIISQCVNQQNDPEHCGSCNVDCGFGGECVLGSCRCQRGLADCNGDPSDGCESLLRLDPANCGACGNACEPGEVCDGTGQCSLTCASGQTDCGGTCVDLRNDRRHCGTCGASCPSGEVCNGTGVCELTCQTGFTNCGGSCHDLTRDTLHCGTCGQACPAGHVCDGTGQCALTCQPGFTECEGVCVDLAGDTRHCGGCGNPCPAGTICDGSGQCQTTCLAGLTQCGQTCADLRSDETNCGACGHACEPGERCEQGACETSCPAGESACGGRCVDTSTDPYHCGACGNVCPGEAACADGVCDERRFRLGSLGLEGCDTTAAFDAGGSLVVTGDLLTHRGLQEMTTYRLRTLAARDHRSEGPKAIVGDLATGAMYAFGGPAGPALAVASTDPVGPIDTGVALVTHLWPIDPSTGQTSGDPALDLGVAVRLPSDAGLLSGWGRVAVATATTVTDIDLTTGAASTQPLSGSLPANPCTGGAYFGGVVELLDGGLHVSYLSGDDVLRTRVSDGATLPLASGIDLGVACAFTVDVNGGTWFLHSSGASRWQPAASDASHLIAACPATVEVPGGATCTSGAGGGGGPGQGGGRP